MKRIALVGLGCTALLVASASSSTARWQLLPKKVTGAGVEVFLPLGWTSGRAWFVGPRYVSTGTKLNFVSARVGGGRLGSFVKSGLRASLASSISYRLVLGSSILVYPGGAPTQLARLGADGKIGDPHPLAGDPEAKTKALFNKDIAFQVVTAAQVGGRTAWVSAGDYGRRSYMAACCTTSGEARDLTSLLSNRSMGIVGRQTLGVDGQGRLWLFWEDCVEKCRLARNLRAVQLDRETLAPRAPSTLRQQTSRDRFQLVCAAACRAVFSSGVIQSWDGESAPKTIARGLNELIAAGYRKGKLIVAYLKYSPGRPTSIVAGQGNAAGLHLRTVSSIKVPNMVGRFSPIGSPLAGFTPHGVVAVQGLGTFSVSRFAAAVLR
jgi:hypothetical protein